MVSTDTSFCSYLLPCWNIFPWIFDFCGLGKIQHEQQNTEERKIFLEFFSKSKYAIFFPNKKWSLKYRSSHHLHVASPLIIKNQLCNIHAIVLWSYPGYYFMNIQFWFHLCIFHLFPHKSVKLNTVHPAFLPFIIFITEMSECFKHGAPCCARCSIHN